MLLYIIGQTNDGGGGVLFIFSVYDEDDDTENVF